MWRFRLSGLWLGVAPPGERGLYRLNQTRTYPFWNYFLWGYELALYRQFVFANRRDYGIGVTSVGGTVEPYRIVCTDQADRRSQGAPLCSA